jgi:pectinesterase
MKLVIFAVLLCGSMAAAEDIKPIKIVLVGDSTVADKSGWGPAFPTFLKEQAKVVNLAAGGRSSKSFIDEGKWDKAIAEKGDYVFIQFGHNDGKGKGPARETDPNTTFAANLKKYVQDTRKAGGKPVLVTSVARRIYSKDGKEMVDALHDFAEATRKVAAETGTPLIDLHAQSLALFLKLGDEASTDLNPPKDRTHFSAKGAQVIAGLVVKLLPDAVPELKAYLK